MPIKLATYNIQYGVGQGGCYDLGRIVETVRGQDVVCLQEVTTAWRVCGMDDQPTLLASGLDMFAAFGPAYELHDSFRDADGAVVNVRRRFGNMVLSRFPILYSRPHALPRPWTEVPQAFHPRVDFPRVALEAVIDVEGTALRVVSVHLSHLPGPQRQDQIEALHGLAHGLPTEPPLWETDPRIAVWSENRPAPPVPADTLFLGDFNLEPDDADYRRVVEPPGGDGLIDGWFRADHRSDEIETCVENDGRLSRLDYLFMTGNFPGRIVRAAVDQTNTSSDHFPVFF